MGNACLSSKYSKISFCSCSFLDQPVHFTAVTVRLKSSRCLYTRLDSLLVLAAGDPSSVSWRLRGLLGFVSVSKDFWGRFNVNIAPGSNLLRVASVN